MLKICSSPWYVCNNSTNIATSGKLCWTSQQNSSSSSWFCLNMMGRVENASSFPRPTHHTHFTTSPLATSICLSTNPPRHNSLFFYTLHNTEIINLNISSTSPSLQRIPYHLWLMFIQIFLETSNNEDSMTLFWLKLFLRSFSYCSAK